MGAVALISRRAAVAVLAVILAVAGCTGESRGDVSAARRFADDYLSAISGDAADRGWSLILPDSRRAYRDQTQYLQLSADAAWESFSWVLVEEGDYCEDGGVYCVVRLEIQGAPDFLIEAPESRPDDRFFTLRMNDVEGVPGNAELTVYFTPGGPRGVLLGGG